MLKGPAFLNVASLVNSNVCNNLGTWSRLGSAFNARPKNSFLKNVGKPNAGLFNIPQLTDYTGFYLLKEQVVTETEELVREACSENRQRPLVQVFDQLSDSLCRVADMADFIRISHPDENFRRGAYDACVSVSSLVEVLNTNQNIYKALKNVSINGDVVELDETDKRVADLFLFDFEQSGVHLSKSERDLFVQLNENIHMLGGLFLENCHEPAEVQRDEIPLHLQNIFSWNGKSVRINSLHSESTSPLVREAAYKIYLHPNKQQTQRLDDLLIARHNMASLSGFETYGHRALRGTLMKTPENVMEFLDMLSKAIHDKTKADFNALQLIKNQNGFKGRIEPWDVPHYCAVAKNQACQSNSKEITSYLPLGACMEGLSNLFSNLFDVTLEVEETNCGEVWSNDVYKLAVKHSTDGILGYIYCDFFERSGKPYQDCHFTIQGGKEKGDHYQKPIVVLMLNLPSPSNNVPSLLTPSMLENLFHEFGHAMHSMLGRTRYQHVTGTRCPTDFAEVPSVLMEYFALEPAVLKSFARHWKTGNVIPDDLAEKSFRTKKLFRALDTSLQILYSEVDQVLHGPQPLNKSTVEVVSDIQKKFKFFECVPGTSWHLRFGHFVGYGAKYYSYLTSRAIASKIWSTCFKKDPFSKSMGNRYKEEVLKFGGEKSPDVLVQNLLKEKPSNKIFADSLVEELEDI